MGESHAKREHEQASTRFAFKGPSVTTARGARLAPIVKLGRKSPS